MKNKGQNLMEFAIILALVSFAGIVVLTAMGGNIKAMFTTSHNKYKEYKPFDWGGGPSSGSVTPTTGGPVSSDPDVIIPDNNIVASNPPATGSPSTSESSMDINNVPVTINSDGSASFTIKGKDINIPAATMDNLNTVFGTAGSAGLQTDVMAAIQKLIEEHADEYPPGQVPVEMGFAQGARDQADYNSTGGGAYVGEAQINSVTLAVGDHKVIIQKDQLCPDSVSNCGQVSILEGYVGVDKSFTGTVTSPYEAVNGLKYYGSYLEGAISGGMEGSSTQGGGTWDFAVAKKESVSM